MAVLAVEDVVAVAVPRAVAADLAAVAAAVDLLAVGVAPQRAKCQEGRKEPQAPAMEVAKVFHHGEADRDRDRAHQTG